MSETQNLKCQFCPLDFASVYKIIPHIYFGHRKKLCRQVRDNGEIRLKSPFPDSQWEHAEAVDVGSTPEEVYAKAAEMFSVLEDHILSVTGEERLTKCPYCQIELSSLPHPYWVHLEEHMNMNNSSPSTPAKTSTPTTPVSASSDMTSSSQKEASQSKGQEATSPQKAQADVSKSEPDSEVEKEPAVAGIEPISKGRVTRSKQKSQEQIRKELLEIEKKIALKKKDEDEKRQIEEEEKRKRAEQEEKEKREEEARLKKIEDDLLRQKEEEELQKEIERQMATEQAQREQAEAKKKKDEEERRRKQEELIRQREEELQRLKEQEEVERQRLRELERKRKDEEERRRMEEEQRRQKEADLKRQVDEQMRLLKQAEESKNSRKDQDHPHASRWDRDESAGSNVIKSPVDMVPLRSPVDVPRRSPAEMMIKSPRSEDRSTVSGRQTPASRTRSREVSGELDREGRRRRSTSGDKKHSSVWRKDREAGGEKQEAAQVSPEQTSKPVLTEEMERSIIYGNFKKKEKTREDKLVDVKKEIEARFKAEEERRKRILEEKRKAEEKEREKQRLADEKLRREKEKLREEKRKTKQRLEELKIKEQSPEPEPEDSMNEEEEEVCEEQPPSPKRTRDKSPDQYEKIKMEIKKIDMEIEKKQEARKNIQSSEEVRSSSISPEPEIQETRTVSLLPPEREAGLVRSVVAYQVEDEDDEGEEEEDELEAMMRDFQERESQKPPEPSPITESKLVSPKVTAKSEIKENPVSSSVTSFEIKCPAWKDLMGSGQCYESAYEFLGDVYLHQRKKIISRSRKARKMVLTCPANSGFSTVISDDGVSIDYFTNELPLHLAALCDHLRSGLTGEDRRPGDHTKAAFWQLLANHRDSRREYCASCNTFPFRNSGCACSEHTDKANKSLEELARDVETGIVKSGDLRPTKHNNDVEMETMTSERRASENERKIEREKEERQIVIPRLPRMFGPEEVRTPASWKYHVMAHKYGEVWCPETQSCILGYKYLEGLADDSGEHRVKVVRYRGDTWLDVDQKKVKVFYDYEGLETVAQVSFNNVTLSGCGANHDQATRNLQQEVKRHTEKLKVLF